VHIPIIGMAMLPVLLGEPLMLLPAHIMFLELIIGPACSIFFEAEADEKNLMQRPPRAANEALFAGHRLSVSLLQGIAALAVAATVYGWALMNGHDENTTRTLIFTAMVTGNIALMLANRSKNSADSPPNPALRWIVLGSGSGLALILSLPVLRELFHFSGNAPLILSVAVLAAISTGLLSTLVKRSASKI
jgi:Ca2+-transporting ATPase